MANYQIQAAYDYEGLSGHMAEWFSELVPGITVSRDIWEQMSQRVISELNKELLELRIIREGFDGNITVPTQIIDSIPAEKTVEEEEAAKIIVPPGYTTFPEDTQAVLVRDGVATPYKTLREAVAAAKNESKTDDQITLIEDIDSFSMLRLDGKVRLNLNGHKITHHTSDYALWVKGDAVIMNGTIECVKPCKGAIFVSSTLVVADLSIVADTGIQLSKRSNAEPGLLDIHGLTADCSVVVDMVQDGNIVNIYGTGISMPEEHDGILLVRSNATKENGYMHKVIIHLKGSNMKKEDFPSELFSPGVLVTFL